MSSSLILQRFSKQLNNPEVLTNPEKFLGPNYKDVLKFWMILDELSQEQLNVVKERYYAFYYENRSERYKAVNLAYEASWEVVGEDNANNAAWAALIVTKSYTALYATRELIGGVENPVFLPMFDNL